MSIKTCFKCNAEKPLSAFYKHKMMADGHLNKCIQCAKNDELIRCKENNLDPIWRETELARQRKKSSKQRFLGIASEIKKETRDAWVVRNKHKKQAHGLVSRAVKAGLIKKLSCEVCGQKNSQAHHDDYNFPLSVKWLCAKHHGERHVELNKIIRNTASELVKA
jgi:hypothetical protein